MSVKSKKITSTKLTWLAKQAKLKDLLIINKKCALKYVQYKTIVNSYYTFHT